MTRLDVGLAAPLPKRKRHYVVRLELSEVIGGPELHSGSMPGGEGHEEEGIPVAVDKKGGLLGVQSGGDSLCLHARSSVSIAHQFVH